MGGGFFWFLIGAGTATMFTKHQQYHQRQQDAYGPGPSPSCRRHAVPPPSPNPSPAPNAAPPSGWGWGAGPVTQAVEQQQQPQSHPQPPRYEGRGFWGRRDAPPSSPEDRERDFRQLRNQAGDAMTEFSEATLDTLMTTIQAAKAKLADRRVQREAEEQRQLDARKY
ncbi:hypothetical protein BDZ89DRAFT_1137113 [Hymenopellis radicata]|nr:hypothetical protein BDZ89DRAFT_1137113 [Hymenopellis radicata]